MTITDVIKKAEVSKGAISAVFRHTFMGYGTDMFSGPSFQRDWQKAPAIECNSEVS